MRFRSSWAIGAVAVLALASACAGPPTKRESGALLGAGLGAAAGAAIGAATGHPGTGAAIGGALGGLGGAAVGDQVQAQDQALDAREREIARNRELIEELKRRQLDVKETSRGVVVNLPDILFEFNKANLTSDARAKVGDIAEILSRPNVRNRHVSVEGHTDSIGSESYNQRLSERRAESVASALESNGVGDERVTARGFGKKYPIAPNTTPSGKDNPEGRAKNRRVEVIIEN
jgi:outer membrane protein OmpA-like peptidoglycan-associated protein